MAAHHLPSKGWLARGTLLLTLAAICIAMFTFPSLHPTQAAQKGRRQEDSLRLISLSQTIMAGEFAEEMEYSVRGSQMLASSIPQARVVEEQLLEAMINSIKYQLAVLINECNQTRRSLVESNEPCAVATLDNVCEEAKREFRSTLSLLRQVRGDKRKFFTRLGDSIKRAGKQLWSAIGPVGRRILRTLGDEVIETVKTPGGLKVKALRVLVRSRIKTLVRGEIRNAIKRGAERLIMNKWEVARGPSGDQCYEGESASEGQVEIDQDCSGDLAWIDEGWPDVEAAMKAEGKYCMDRGDYRRCLIEKTQEGNCPEEVVQLCHPVYEAIPPLSPGEYIEIEDHEAFYRDTDNLLEINFPLAGGNVTGYMEVDFDDSPFDGWYCFVTITYSFTGTYDPGSCILSGTGTHDLMYEEAREGDCLGYSGPVNEVREWGMRITNGRLDTCGFAPGALICEGYDLWETE